MPEIFNLQSTVEAMGVSYLSMEVLLLFLFCGILDTKLFTSAMRSENAVCRESICSFGMVSSVYLSV